MTRAGGSYKFNPDTGKTTRVEETTKDHPKGNKARLADQKDEPTGGVEQPSGKAQKKVRGNQ